MTDRPWTPEPWVLHESPEDQESEHPYFVANPPLQRFVADVLTEADARLIAAAPELAELLEMAVVYFDDHLPEKKRAEALLNRIRGDS